ncbi:BatD family protein [Colwellia psychrerythraea]|uniref:Aerotolerance-related protein BatD n=1 Tax=Colwellia psychrerythraea TaxID=28229 RepID=A0A099K9K0_COLPS|nr:BatD family protein [Colwellia psychrerythraea]KGJ87409.1 Aerotolerance-related protein BatD [Colwellia psychrerythraea]
MVTNFSKHLTTKQPFNGLQSIMLTLLVMATLLLSNNVYALSKVTATIDKNPAMINESILLTVIADDDVNRNALDTAPLLEHFIVGQTSVSSQTSMVNFKTSRMTKWQIILVARSAGEFVIPALSIENHQSEPVELTIVAANGADSNIQADIFITSELSNDEVYVQQLLTLSIKLHFAVELKSGNLTEPSLTGATFEKIGQDKQSDAIINGKRYRVIEQTYAITPEESGEFTLKAPLFSGDILQASKRRSSFLSFAQTKPVSILGDEIKIKVLPIPANYPSDAQWLPTDILTLHQEWQAGNDNFTVGEPITRTITLTAAGLSKAQLPKLKMQSSRGLKIYPDQAELHANLSNERLVSQKVQNFALVPSSAGDFVLPAMSITWFNTITNKIELATLPAQTISVQAGEDNVAANVPSDINHKYSEITNNSNKSKHLTMQVPLSGVQTLVQDKRLQWLFLSLWLLTSLAWLIHISYLKRNKQTGSKNYSNQTANSGNNYIALLAACKKNNAEQALNLILPWLRDLFASRKPGVEINTIAQAQTYVQEQSFATALNDLQQHLYGKSAINGAPSWQGLVLLSAIQTVQKQQSTNKNANELLALNP